MDFYVHRITQTEACGETYDEYSGSMFVAEDKMYPNIGRNLPNFLFKKLFCFDFRVEDNGQTLLINSKMYGAPCFQKYELDIEETK